MSEIPQGYPHSCKSNEIESAVDEFSEELNSLGLETSASLPRMNQRSQLVALIQQGRSELQNRQTKFITRVSACVSILSMIVAGTALYVSLTASRSYARWESDQMEILGTINNNIKSSSENINKTLTNKLDGTQKVMIESSNKVVKAIKALENNTANKSIKPPQ